MSVANLERFNLGVAIDKDADGIWCRHASHLASVDHLEKSVAKLTAERDSIRDALRIVQAASIAHAGEQNGVIAALREQVRGLRRYAMHTLTHCKEGDCQCGLDAALATPAETKVDQSTKGE